MKDKGKSRSKSGRVIRSSSPQAAKGAAKAQKAATVENAGKPASKSRDANRTKKIKEMKALLLQRREELLQGMQHSMRYQSSPAPTKGDSSDLAANSLDSDTAMQLAESGSSELVQIGEALQNVADGTYGQCESCSDEIPLARLEALPYATLCIRCKEEQERSGSGGTSAAGWSAVDELEDLEQSMG